jgi:hypothetical protein
MLNGKMRCCSRRHALLGMRAIAGGLAALGKLGHSCGNEDNQRCVRPFVTVLVDQKCEWHP